MTPERWQRVQELFYGAEELPTKDRPSWLEEQCAGDEDLKAEVHKLLHSSAQDEDLLEESILSTASEMLTTESVGEGGRLGPYELVRTLGQGGMGLVYLAKRADQSYEQNVAVKVIQAYLGNQELLLRFRTERQILAQLSHTNIAKLLDGGVTPNGQPYLVMEYVDGPRIDDYCRTHNLGVPGKLELFRQICAGVQAAHQNLVVHRDIKPANILVNSDGVPKLLDFGIAKLLVPGQIAQTVAMTRHSERLMTLEYASPEQILGQAITTATDVYALGVLLYELLTGIKPFEHRTTIGELETRVLREDPQRPSSLSGRTLDADLDNIVLKAMHKDANRRYATAAELSEDVRRYLDGFPVLARPDSFRYRTSKFVRRHRLAVFAAGAFAATIVAFGVGLANYANEADLARIRAQRERTRAERVSQFLMDLFHASDPDKAQTTALTARAMLDKGVDEASKIQGQPEVKTQLLRTLGLIYENLGEYPTSRRLLSDGLALSRQTFGEESEETALLEKALAELYRRAGNFEQAASLARQSLATRRKLRGPNDGATAETLNTVALNLHDAGQYEAAEPYFRELLAIRPVLRQRLHLETAVLSNAGALYQNLGDYPRAEKLLSECVSIRRRELGGAHPRLALALTKLASVLSTVYRYEEALSHYEEALLIYRKVHNNPHPDLLRALAGLAESNLSLGRLKEAEKHLSECQAIASRVPATTALETRLSFNAVLLASAQRRFGEAETMLRKTIERRQSNGSGGPPSRGKMIRELAILLLEQNKTKEAESTFRQADALLGPQLRTALDHAEHYAVAARIAKAAGDNARAKQLAEEARKNFLTTIPLSHPRVREVSAFN